MPENPPTDTGADLEAFNAAADRILEGVASLDDVRTWMNRPARMQGSHGPLVDALLPQLLAMATGQAGERDAFQRELDAAQDAVLDAWTVAGPVPSVHHHPRRQLRDTWPKLAKALERAERARAGVQRFQEPPAPPATPPADPPPLTIGQTALVRWAGHGAVTGEVQAVSACGRYVSVREHGKRGAVHQLLVDDVVRDTAAMDQR